MIIKFEYYGKCIRIYGKAHLISNFRKKYLLSWGSNPRNETKPEEIYDNERVCDRKIVLSFLLDFSRQMMSLKMFKHIFQQIVMEFYKNSGLNSYQNTSSQTVSG